MLRTALLACVAITPVLVCAALVAAPPKKPTTGTAKAKPVRPEPHAGALTPEEIAERKKEILRGRGLIRDYLFKKSGVKAEKPSLKEVTRLKIVADDEPFKEAEGDTKKIYGIIAKQLRLAEAALDQDDAEASRYGLWRFHILYSYASYTLKDRELAWMIAECWLLGSLDKAPKQSNHPLSRNFLYGLTLAAARNAGQWERTEYLAHELELTSEKPNTVNAARWHRSAALESLGRHQDAIEVLQAIPEDSSFVHVKKRIPVLEKVVTDKAQKTPAQ